MKTYKLFGYHPYWINNETILNFYHIEVLLEQVNIINPWVEFETNNYNWNNINGFEFLHKLDDNLEYIKIVQNNQTYYYSFIKKDEVGTIDKDGNLIVKYYFTLDKWNTFIYVLLKLLLDAFCVVHFKRIFLDRLLRYEDKYVLNYTLQKYLLDVIPLPNITNKREYVNGTTARKIYELNNPNYGWDDLPTEYTIPSWNPNTSHSTIINIKEWFGSEENNSGDNHRFCYLIGNSSALRKIDNNQKDLSVNTSQKIIIIPLPATHKDTILHALNDIDITLQHDECIILGNQNTIASKLVEGIPYAVLFDWYIKNTDKARFVFGVNKVSAGNAINIPFFEINFNQPLLVKLFNYLTTNSKEGMGKKVRDLINNLDKLLPTTEPLMFNPLYYYEIYNNGLTQYSVSFNDLHLEFNKTTAIRDYQEWVLQAYINFFSTIDISYYFGERTNIYNTSLDNTNTKTIDISIPFGLAQGASANYLENYLNTGYTSLLNRRNERAQAYADMGFNTAILGLDIIGTATSTTAWLNPGKSGTQIAKDAVKITQTITDTAMTQQRADTSFFANIKNITNAPSNISTSPFSKANIPLPEHDGNYLMNTYAITPIEQCLDIVFIDYLHNGYIYDAYDNVNKFVNRKYMNVLSISSLDTQEDILNIWERNYDNKVFKNKFWFTDAINFLSQPHKFYMTPYLVNCTNHKGNAYVHNVETTPYDIERIQTPIEHIITNTNIEVAPKHTQSILGRVVELNPLLGEYINDVEIIPDYNNGYFVINSKPYGDLVGQIVVFTYFYSAIITQQNINYYVDSLSDLWIDYDIYEQSVRVYKENEGITTIDIGDRDGCMFSLSIIPQIDSDLVPSRDLIIHYAFCAWCAIEGEVIIPNWSGLSFNGSIFRETNRGRILTDMEPLIVRVKSTDAKIFNDTPESAVVSFIIGKENEPAIIYGQTQEQIDKWSLVYPSGENRFVRFELDDEQR